MKKVMVLLIVAALLAAPAFAGIRNSKHDLSSSSTSSSSVKSTDTDELCVFCHTPHGGATGGFAPLWNRSTGSLTLGVGDLYNSATLEAAITAPSVVVDNVNNSDALLCLSCHDGSSLATGLLNPPASNGNANPSFNADPDDRVSGFTDLTLDGPNLKNDHPIGFTYATALNTADSEIKDPAAVAAIGDVGTAGVVLGLYDMDSTTGAQDVMWCSTCHDVHNPDKGTPFLNMTNDGSAMCLTCHDK